MYIDSHYHGIKRYREIASSLPCIFRDVLMDSWTNYWLCSVVFLLISLFLLQSRARFSLHVGSFSQLPPLFSSCFRLNISLLRAYIPSLLNTFPTSPFPVCFLLKAEDLKIDDSSPDRRWLSQGVTSVIHRTTCLVAESLIQFDGACRLCHFDDGERPNKRSIKAKLIAHTLRKI